MNFIKIVGLVMVAAAFAIGTLAAGTSAASPEFTKESVLGFAFLEHTSTEPPVDRFYVKSVHVRIDCWAELAHSLTLKIRTHKAVFIFRLCIAEQTERKEKCSVRSPGAEKGEIVSKTLEGNLGYINKATKEVGILFKAEGASTEFAVVETESGSCFGLFNSVKVEGSVIGQIKPVNVETTEGEIIFATKSEEQSITKFEGVSGEDVLDAFGLLASLEAHQNIVFHEKEKLVA